MYHALIALPLAASVYSGTPCFDTELVFEANARLGLERRWHGIEAAPFNLGHTLALFLARDGSRWALWSIHADEACLIAKGIEWRRAAARPYLR